MENFQPFVKIEFWALSLVQLWNVDVELMKVEVDDSLQAPSPLCLYLAHSTLGIDSVAISFGAVA